jgi:hypothetical protein
MSDTQKQNPNPRENWKYAIGMAKTDGGKPSEEFLNDVKKHINKELTTEDITERINRRYAKAGASA